MAEARANGGAAGEGDARPRVMVLQAHPDDAEFLCAGTVARFVAGGYRVPFIPPGLRAAGDRQRSRSGRSAEGTQSVTRSSTGVGPPVTRSAGGRGREISTTAPRSRRRCLSRPRGVRCKIECITRAASTSSEFFSISSVPSSCS